MDVNDDEEKSKEKPGESQCDFGVVVSVEKRNK